MALSRKPQEIVEDSQNPLLAKHESWERVPVGDIADILNGFAFKSNKFTKDKGMPLIRIRDVGKDASETYYDGEFDETYLVNDGDLLVGMDGDFRAAIWKGGKALLNQRVCKISLKSGEYDFKFLSYVLQPYLDAIHAETSAVTVKHLSSRSISEIPLPLPPKEQQKRIVAKIEELFSHIDAGIEALKKAKQLLKQYRQAVLKAAVTGELTKEWREANKAKLEHASQLLERILKERREKWEEQQLEQFKAKGKMPKDDKWKKKYKDGLIPTQSDLNELAPYDIPESWNLMTVDQLTYFLTDGEHATPPRTDEGIPLLSARNVQDGWLSFEKIDHVSEETHEKLSERLKVRHGDVLLSCSGTVGRSCMVPENSNFSLVRSVAVLRPVLENGEFMSFSLRSGMLQSQIDRKKTQTAQANIFQGKIKTLIISVPPLPEQNEIVRVIKENFEATERLESEVDVQLMKAEKNKQSVLASAFIGGLI